MKIFFLLFSILIFSSVFGLQESFAEEFNQFKWNYDGAISSSGCKVINGNIVDDNNLQKCVYRDKLFKIVDIDKACGEAMTSWTDPETQKTFSYTDTCDHPLFCDKNGGADAPYGMSTASEYLERNSVNDLFFGENVWFISKFTGDVCYGTLDLKYSQLDNRIDVEIDGQWNNTVVEISIPPQLHTPALEVQIDESPVDFSITKNFKDNTLVRENSILQVIPPKSNYPQKITILPHGIINPYETNVPDKNFLKNKTNSINSEAPNSSHSNILPPLKQVQNGVAPNDVACKENFNLIFKSSDHSPACVKSSTAEKLIKRNSWVSSWMGGIVSTSSSTDTTSMTKKYASLVDSNNQFAFDFYSEITNQNENIFFSPYSIMNAFAIVNEGAKEDTKKEINNVFGFPEDSKILRDDFSKISESLNQENSAYELQVANALWVTELYNLKPEFVEATKVHYDSQVESVDFVSDDGVNKMNSWVSNETNQKIKQILKPGSTNAETVFFVTNAIYFKGTWVTQFEEKSTIDDDFWLNSEDKVPVKMMNLYPKYLSHGEFEELEILKLPYEGDRLSLMVLLPNQIDGLGSVEESISNEKLRNWIAELDSNFVAVSIPKFKLETDYDLKELLEEMGLELIFDDKKADLSGIAELSGPFGVLHVNKAIHKAFVDVNEEGTEAAAVTAIGGMYESSMPPKPHIFKTDHPFMFLIWDDETQSILFLGKISNPEGLG